MRQSVELKNIPLVGNYYNDILTRLSSIVKATRYYPIKTGKFAGTTLWVRYSGKDDIITVQFNFEIVTSGGIGYDMIVCFNQMISDEFSLTVKMKRFAMKGFQMVDPTDHYPIVYELLGELLNIYPELK